MKSLLLKAIRIGLSYVFLVAGIYTALSLDAGSIPKAVIISVVWLCLAGLDEILFWHLIKITKGGTRDEEE